MKLREMYQQERERRGVRASVLAVAKRTGKTAEEVAEKLGLRETLWRTAGLDVKPAERLRCDVCREMRAGMVIVTRAGESRFCQGCGLDLRRALPE